VGYKTPAFRIPVWIGVNCCHAAGGTSDRLSRLEHDAAAKEGSLVRSSITPIAPDAGKNSADRMTLSKL
jgi:hypothetical protein